MFYIYNIKISAKFYIFLIPAVEIYVCSIIFCMFCMSVVSLFTKLF